jgi:hypothetical protein
MALTHVTDGDVEAVGEACAGPVHDFVWHRQNRGLHSGHWVDLATTVAWAGLIAWMLLHH